MPLPTPMPLPLPTTDSQFPPGVYVGGDRTQRHVVVENGEITWVTVVVGPDRYNTERSLSLDVPAGMRVVGLAVDDGNGPVWAALRPRWDALYDYFHGQTPTLVEEAGTSYGEDHFVVRISDGGTFTFALCSTCDGIDDHQALFLETNRPRRGVVIDVGPGVAVSPTYIDHAIIKREIDFHVTQLRRCWMEVAQRDRVEGDVELKFQILEDGTTSAVDVTTATQLAAARACLVGVVAALTFPSSETSVQINYPIKFELDR